MNCVQATTKAINRSVSELLLSAKHSHALQSLVNDTGITLS